MLTQPRCVALVIAAVVGAPRAPRTSRWLLLLPIPDDAHDEANAAVRHYVASVESVRDIADAARANPVLARTFFWTLLVISIAAAATGFALEANDYPGQLPAVLGVGGTMIGLGILLIGWKVRASSET